MARGYIRKRGTNRWQLTYDTPRGPDGKRQQRYETIQGTKRQAEARLTEILDSLRRGQYVEPSMMPLGNYLDRWLRESSRHWEPTTTSHHEGLIRNHIRPALGYVPLTLLTALEVQRFLGKCSDAGLSSQTVLHIRSTLRQALNQAVRWNLLPKSIMDNVVPPKLIKREIRPLSKDEITLLLTEAEGTDYFVPIHLAIYTGMRRGEICGLRWGDVDLAKGSIAVRVQKVMLNGRPILKKVKSAASRRTLRLAQPTTLLLRSLRELREAQLAEWDVPITDDTQVCVRPNGRTLAPNPLYDNFKIFAERCGITGVRFHDLRHTHASLLLTSGVPLHEVKEQLGHSTIQITIDTYGHLMPSAETRAAEAVAKMLI